MCRLFIEADPELWASETRSVRICGVASSVRLEKFYWLALQELAGRDGLTVGKLISKLADELIAAGHGPDAGDITNFASFLRVCCGRYLALQAAGDLSTDPTRPLRDVDAPAILARESQRRKAQQRKAQMLQVRAYR
ncbi:MAG: ribbon-helix-helix domain-containing protein [Neomegalonema sp.]|nr:ribbon-helix-helix domain-containing protein [Neomegalonema sp.]